MLSNFPEQLDNIAEDKNNDTPAVDDHAQHHNKLAAAINTIQEALGINLKNVLKEIFHSEVTLDDGTNPHNTTKTDIGLDQVDNSLQLKASENLNDLSDSVDARNNLGLGSAATQNVGNGVGDVVGIQSNGKISETILPSIAITKTYTVENDTQRNSLIVDEGDIAIVTSSASASNEPATYIWSGTEWIKLKGPTDKVDSVFSRTGTIIAENNDYTWAQINKTTSSIADITTRNHSDLNFNDGTNPHGTTKANVGLGNVDNFGSSSSVNLNSSTTFATSKAVRDHHVLSNNPHSVTKTQVGLSSVTNDAQLKIASNLADLNNASTARGNLGLGSAATQADTRYAHRGNNLSDLSNPGTARNNLGLGTAATQADTRYAHRTNNLSDLSNAGTARGNLGLGSAAVQNDTRYNHRANNLSDVSNASTARSNLGLGSAAVQNDARYGQRAAANTWSQLNNFTGGLQVNGANVTTSTAVVANSFPTSGNFAGRVTYRTDIDALFMFNGSTWLEI